MRIRTTIAFGMLLAALAITPAAQAKGTAYVVGNMNELGAMPVAVDGSLGAVAAVPTGAFTPRSVAITPDARYLYITSVNSRVIGFDITGATPTQVTGSPFNVTDTDGHGVAITPNGGRLYSVNKNGNAGSVSIFDIDADGSLTKLGGNVALGYGVQGIAISPSGANLYITEDTGDVVHSFSIGANGSITEVGTARAAGAGAKGIATTPDGQFVLTAATGGQINAFPVQGDGSLGTSASTVNTAKVLQTAAVSQDGRFLYVADFGAPGAVWAYAIGGDGALTPVTGQPFAAVDNTYGVDAAPGGTTVYSASFDAANPADRVNGYASGADGALSGLPGSPYDGLRGLEFQSIAITPNQGPTALFTAVTLGAGQPTEFNASSSNDQDGGAVARYDWDFGDGTTLPNGGPTPSYTYAQQGTYQVTLTVTDDQGCSTQQLFTGQTADCNPAPAGASLTQEVQIAGGGDGPETPPDLKLKGKKQELAKKVTVKAKTADDTDAVAKGKVQIKKKGSSKRKGYSLKKAKKSLDANEQTKLKPKLSKKAYKKAKKALKKGGKVAAKVSVKVTDDNSDTDKETVKVKLKKP